MNEDETKATNSEINSILKDEIPSDNEIKSRIEYTLRLNPLIESKNIDVEVTDRSVSLKGFVNAFWKKRNVKTISENTKGVLRVKNALDIIPTRDYPDEEIAHELGKALDRRPVVSREDVDIGVSNGEVTLEGTVPNWFIYSQIKITSENTQGVIDVVDKIKIEI